ncbi:hypothetical protein HYW21_03790 [Candidatus Woesearchaeota archaeon]|nr:hypothetical protein [Candidatus Woesearchaeota archaeon]
MKPKLDDENQDEEELADDDEDIYTEEGIEELEEDDELSPQEAGFMEGAKGKGNLGDCAACGKPLGDREERVYERKWHGTLYRFCSKKCAEKGPK